MTEAQLRDLARFEESDSFNRAEKLALRLAVAMTKTPAAIDDTFFTELSQEFNEPQLTELSAAVARENHRARFNRVFGVGAEGYSKGAFCPLPE